MPHIEICGQGGTWPADTASEHDTEIVHSTWAVTRGMPATGNETAGTEADRGQAYAIAHTHTYMHTHTRDTVRSAAMGKMAQAFISRMLELRDCEISINLAHRFYLNRSQINRPSADSEMGGWNGAEHKERAGATV